MYNHSSSVFNNNCLTTPKNPRLDQPSPLYEHKFIYQLENQAKKLGLDSSGMPKKNVIDRDTTKAFLEFISNIPEYDEVNHLSNKEFYKKLENLKEKQRMYEEYLQNEIKFDGKDSEWIEDYKKLKLGNKNINKDQNKKISLKPFCTTPILSTVLKTPDVDLDYDLLDKEVSTKPSSRRSVRIETPSDKPSINVTPEPLRPKSRVNLSSAESKNPINEWEDFGIEDLNLCSERNTPLRMESKTAPNSPVKTRNINVDNDDGITIPKPFQMTVR